MRHNLEELLKIIKDRRTIRPGDYSDKEVSKEDIQTILESAIWAPSHYETEPWRFKVYRGENKLKVGDFLKELYLKKVPADKQDPVILGRVVGGATKASAIIAVTMKRQNEEEVPEIEEIEAVACAVQNMHLTATALGLAALWGTPNLIYTEEMNEFLNIDKKDKCLGLFYLGHPAVEWPAGKRQNSVENVTEWIE